MSFYRKGLVVTWSEMMPAFNFRASLYNHLPMNSRYCRMVRSCIWLISEKPFRNVGYACSTTSEKLNTLASSSHPKFRRKENNLLKIRRRRTVCVAKEGMVRQVPYAHNQLSEASVFTLSISPCDRGDGWLDYFFRFLNLSFPNLLLYRVSVNVR